MYSAVSVLQKSDATGPLVESHETSMMRLVPEERTRTLPAAVSTARCQSCSWVSGPIFSALRHIPSRSGGGRSAGCGCAWSFSTTRVSSTLLWSSFTWVWMSVSR